MKLRDAVALVRRFSVNAGNSVSTYDDVVAAITLAGEEFLRRTRLSQTVGELSIVADTAVFSPASLTDFAPRRLLSAELTYVNQGTWATSTSYVEGEYVQGDGSPDSLLYLCVEDHTSSGSNEPPNTDYWQQIAYQGGMPLKHVQYDDLSLKLVGESTDSRPTHIAFRTPTEGLLFPVPSQAYTMRLSYYKSLVTSGTLNIPDEYIHGVLVYGATAALQHTNPELRYGTPSWQKFEGLIESALGEDTDYQTGDHVRDHREYL